MNKVLVVVVGVIAALGLVGCIIVIALAGLVAGGLWVITPVTSSQSSPPDPTVVAVAIIPSADPEDTEWVLTAMDGDNPVEGANVVLQFAGGLATGFTGCNSYGGEYIAGDDGTLTIPEIDITEQFCPTPEGIMEQEEAYIRSLGDANSFRLLDDRLEIIDASGETILAFVKMEGSTPSVMISPSAGPSGTMVNVVASGFPPNTPVSVGLGPAKSEFSGVATGTTDADGRFIVELPVVGDPGMSWVFGVGGGAAHAISAPFQITNSNPSVSISPTSGPSGTTVEVVAMGLQPSTPISVGLGPANSEFTEVAHGSTDTDGRFTVQVPVQGEAGMDWVFGVSAADAHAISVPFHITH